MAGQHAYTRATIDHLLRTSASVSGAGYAQRNVRRRLGAAKVGAPGNRRLGGANFPGGTKCPTACCARAVRNSSFGARKRPPR